MKQQPKKTHTEPIETNWNYINGKNKISCTKEENLHQSCVGKKKKTKFLHASFTAYSALYCTPYHSHLVHFTLQQLNYHLCLSVVRLPYSKNATEGKEEERERKRKRDNTQIVVQLN